MQELRFNFSPKQLALGGYHLSPQNCSYDNLEIIHSSFMKLHNFKCMKIMHISFWGSDKNCDATPVGAIILLLVKEIPTKSNI